ncbi:hypothetical protein Efla_001939 [Eimeria flavescens]
MRNPRSFFKKDGSKPVGCGLVWAASSPQRPPLTRLSLPPLHTLHQQQPWGESAPTHKQASQPTGSAWRLGNRADSLTNYDWRSAPSNIAKGFCSAMSSAADRELLVERMGGKNTPVHVVTLNRPQAQNALSLSMLHFLLDFVQNKANKDALVILQGNGDKAFCAGHSSGSSSACNIVTAAAAFNKRQGGDVRSVCLGEPSHAISFFSCEYQLNLALAEEEGPMVVSVWDGIVFGGGVGLSVHGGLRICTEKTIFSMPEVHIGLFPDCGMTQRLASLQPPGLGLYLGLTGARLKAADLLLTAVPTGVSCVTRGGYEAVSASAAPMVLVPLGLATHFVPCAILGEALERLKEGPPLGANVKQWASQTIDEVVAHQGSISKFTASRQPQSGRLLTPDMLAFLKQHFAEVTSLQGLLDSLRENARTCPLCASTLDRMEKACPLSLAVTFKAITDRQHAAALATAGAAREAAPTPKELEGPPTFESAASESLREQRLQLLSEAMAIELVLICNLTAISNYNFREGVRALLLDKDKKPKWRPDKVEDVTEGDIARLFESQQSPGPAKL